MPSRILTPTPRTVYPNRYRQHPMANRLPAPFAGELRRCLHSGCITILNGYNPGPFCMIHTPDEADAPYMKQLDRELDREARRARKLAPAR